MLDRVGSTGHALWQMPPCKGASEHHIALITLPGMLAAGPRPPSTLHLSRLRSPALSRTMTFPGADSQSRERALLLLSGAAAASLLPALWRRLRRRAGGGGGGSVAAAAAADPTRSTTSSAGGGVSAYESRKAVDEYLQFHYGRPEEVMPWGDAVPGAKVGWLVPDGGGVEEGRLYCILRSALCSRRTCPMDLHRWGCPQAALAFTEQLALLCEQHCAALRDFTGWRQGSAGGRRRLEAPVHPVPAGYGGPGLL